jgi:zinc and cadmium transporter
MSTLGYILLFTFLGSIGALVGGLILITREKFALKISHFLASFAAGTLLGTAFFDLLPEAHHGVEEAVKAGGEEINIFLWTLVGILLFFIIERFIHWFHHHEEHHQEHDEAKSTIPLIIISDTIHNFIDGILIAATFMISIPLGIVTTFAVAAHEIPQEIGDFGLLLHKGLSRKKVILVNILSASVALVAALMTYIFGAALLAYIPVFLAITAGFFIYIASSDLIPEIHFETRKGFALIETLLLLIGVLTIYLSTTLLGHGH